MSELRKDPIVDRWVIVAPNRAQRPNAFNPSSSWCHGSEGCPFCEGQEHRTPGELLACRGPDGRPDGPGWRVRVVPNKFPALESQPEVRRWTDGIYRLIEGVGAHEVVVESPRHVASTSDVSVEQLAEVFSVYRRRLNHWEQDRRLRYGMIFKNVGPEAGASLEHSHSQLIVTPTVPTIVCDELAGALDFHRREGRCVYCEMVRQELDSGCRVVLETPNYLALAPFAGRVPYETWVLPKHHASHFQRIDRDPRVDEDRLVELASLVRQTIANIEAVADRPAYNYVLHTAPFDTPELVHYHWHIEIMPSLTKAAGFEWGSGYYINPLPPEDAAARLRRADVGSASRETD